jgi:hypothetical protein
MEHPAMDILTSPCVAPDEAVTGPALLPGRAAPKAIVMVSIGARAWRDLPAETFARYAQITGADFYLETQIPSAQELPLPAMPDTPGRRNKIAYASKAYFVFKYLSMGYDKVIIVDDTCIVSRIAPNIFEIVPPMHCGFRTSDRKSARKSFEAIRAFQTKREEDPLSFDATQYMNSGFMLYDASMRSAFAPERIIDAKELLYSKFPNQTLTYYLLKRSSTKLFRLPEGFNVVPANHLSRRRRKSIQDVRPHLGKANVYHVTSAYVHRMEIIEQIYDHVTREWLQDQPYSAGPFCPETFALRREVLALRAKNASSKNVHENTMPLWLRRMERSLSSRIVRPFRELAHALTNVRS